MNDLKHEWYGPLKRQAVDRGGGKLYCIAIIALLIGLNVYAPASPTLIQRALASAIGLLAFGFIGYWTYRRHEPEFGFLPIVSLFYFLYFSVAIFTQKSYQMNVDFGANVLSDPTVNKALLLSLLGLAMIFTGYYWPGRMMFAKFIPKFQMQWQDRKAVELIAITFMGLSTAAFVVSLRLRTSASVQAYLNMPGELFFLAMIALFILQLKGELSFRSKVVMWGVFIPARIIIGMAQGAFGLSMIVVIALAIVYATMRGRMPWMVFVAGIGALVVLQPVKGSLRQSVYLQGTINKEQGQIDKLSAFVDSAELGWSVLQIYAVQDVIAIATARLADILVFATIVEHTPLDIPYWNGASYYRLLFVPIPRILYPEKPEYTEGNVMAHQYGMIQEEDYVTSINLPQLVECYGNFGPIGVILGCCILGIVYRTIHDCLLHKSCGLGALAAGLYLFAHLTDIENSTASVFGSLLLESLIVLFFHYSIRLTEAFLAALKIRRRIEPRGFVTATT